MKAKIVLGVLVVVTGAALGVAAQSSGPDPLCRPGVPCEVETKTLDGGPDPICLPGKPCQVEARVLAGGNPDPICRPGIPCSNGTKRY